MAFPPSHPCGGRHSSFGGVGGRPGRAVSGSEEELLRGDESLLSRFLTEVTAWGRRRPDTSRRNPEVSRRCSIWSQGVTFQNVRLAAGIDSCCDSSTSVSTPRERPRLSSVSLSTSSLRLRGGKGADGRDGERWRCLRVRGVQIKKNKQTKKNRKRHGCWGVTRPRRCRGA